MRHKTEDLTNNRRTIICSKEFLYIKATGIERRIDEHVSVVIPKEIRRTMRIREGDPSQMTLERWEKFCFAMLALSKRWGVDDT